MPRMEIGAAWPTTASQEAAPSLYSCPVCSMPTGAWLCKGDLGAWEVHRPYASCPLLHSFPQHPLLPLLGQVML